MSAVERFSIAQLRFAGGKEHDVNYVSEVHYDAALAREAQLRVDRDDDANTFNLAMEKLQRSEAALREGLTTARRDFDYDRGFSAGSAEVETFRLERDAIQQRLTVAEQLLRRVHKSTALTKAGDLWKKIDAELEPAAEVEALGTRPVGCCCPPKGHTGIWAAAMCPVHFGLKRLGVKP